MDLIEYLSYNRAIMKKISKVVFVLLFLFLFASSMMQKKEIPRSTQNPQKGLNQELIRLIQTANEVSVSKVGPNWGEDKKFRVLSKEHRLNEVKKEELARILQDDDSYRLDQVKMCLFVPELMIHMGEDLQILVNKTGKQLEFYYDGVREKVECDPSYAKIMSLFEGIEWEDLREK